MGKETEEFEDIDREYEEEIDERMEMKADLRRKYGGE